MLQLQDMQREMGSGEQMLELLAWVAMGIFGWESLS